jgi:hypothetical protein
MIRVPPQHVSHIPGFLDYAINKHTDGAYTKVSNACAFV